MQNDRELSIFFRRERENGFDEKLDLYISQGFKGWKIVGEEK